MGLAASQARMLSLVARKSDLEYRGQMINQRRLRIATLSEEIAKSYTDAISNRILKFKDTDNNELSLTSIHLSDNGYAVVDQDGNRIISTTDDSAKIERGLRSGQYQLRTFKDGVVGSEDLSWSTNTSFNDYLYTADDAAAEATYAYKSAELQTQDKRLELELKNVDTQHNAVQTEIDAVKKVIDKNIESSFKTFG